MAKHCSIVGCDKPANSRGWCSMHYARWRTHGDPLVCTRLPVDLTQSKVCTECSATFHPTSGTSRAQWERRRCCSQRCANSPKARGRARQLGDLDTRQGKNAYLREWQRRKQMPAWAASWEERRRIEDLDDLADAAKPVRGRAAQRIAKAPKPRQWIAGACPTCGASVTVIRGWWHGSVRCPKCTKARWRMNNEKRARFYSVPFEDIPSEIVFARDRNRCQICKQKTRGKYPAPTSATVDHIIPLSRGGPHLLHNLQTACLRCNLKKHAGAANDQLRLAITA